MKNEVFTICKQKNNNKVRAGQSKNIKERLAKIALTSKIEDKG